MIKKVLFLFVFAFFISSCQDNNKYDSFGKQISATDALQLDKVTNQYNNLKTGERVQIKFEAKAKDVCQAKGCWMTLDLENGEQVMVKFKDYAFFVPKDISGKEVVLNGKAFIEEVSVEEQRHYAQDAGKTEAEILTITKPKRTLSFEADGVLIKQ